MNEGFERASRRQNDGGVRTQRWLSALEIVLEKRREGMNENVY